MIKSMAVDEFSLTDEKRRLIDQYPPKEPIKKGLENSISVSPKGGNALSNGSLGRLFEIAEPKRIDNFNLEYRQEMELWSQNIKIFFFFGGNAKEHHTGTKTRFYLRKINSEEPWHYIGSQSYGNHGAKPDEEDMQRYTTCYLPVTQGWIAFGGECDGLWGIGHLCNDDTAHQIWHGHGNWNNGEHHCIGKKRLYRPWCQQPW